MAIRDIVQAAAGVGGGDKLYVDDVFSTYLYTGNGATQTIENGIALGDSNYGPSVEFDGTNDYLSRSSDMTGNADGKTFTFSGWFYKADDSITHLYAVHTTGVSAKVEVQIANYWQITGRTSGGSKILDAYTSAGFAQTNVLLNSWNHVVISIDMANTSYRYVYVNGVNITSRFNWSAYSNDNIDFSPSPTVDIRIGSTYSSPVQHKGRLSNLFLDYTYRDLSVEANRRLFITADGQPATGQASLSPILYMLLDGSTASVGTNSGTGGDFTVNGSPTVLTQGGPYIESGYGQGGLVWGKSRNAAGQHYLIDTARGSNYSINSNTTGANSYDPDALTAFTSSGFSVGTSGSLNTSATTYASWTFRKAPKFFDIVTWTGDDTTNRTHAHNLGSVPGLIIVKATSRSNNWTCYHRSLGNTKGLSLNSTDAAYNSTAWNSTSPTDSVFTATSGTVNEGGHTYVAYLFAHDAGGFGDDGEQNVISCGSFTETGSLVNINLGWEPQFLLLKRVNGTGNWWVFDTTRGFVVGSGSSLYLAPNLVQPEIGVGSWLFPEATGFGANVYDGAGAKWVYIAIRRPMKTPEAGTEVFSVTYGGSTSPKGFTTGFPVDMDITTSPVDDPSKRFHDRLRGKVTLFSNSTAAETVSSYDSAGYFQNDLMDRVWNTLGTNWINYAFKRAPSFMDVVCYTGNGTAGRTVAHNLGVTPEWIIVKRRTTDDGSGYWASYSAATGNTKSTQFGVTGAALTNSTFWNNTSPTSTDFTVGTITRVNGSAQTYVSYLFATLAGVSKCGSYTGTAADLNVDCGFSAGARFILIKRTDVVGDWYVWDSVRGIAAGNDPYMLLNSNAAEVTNTDYIDPLASGFTVTSSAPAALNASGGSYIFLAIA